MSLSPFSTPTAAPASSHASLLRPRMTPTAIVYVAIVLVALVSVLAAHRVIERQRTAEREMDAERASLTATSFLTIHVGALRSLQTIFMDDLPSSAEIDVALSTLPVGDGGFQRLFFVDTTGRVLREARYEPGGGTQMRVGDRIDTTASPGVAAIVRAAAASQSVVIGAAQRTNPDSNSVFFMAMAAYHGDRVVGFVGGVLGSSGLDRRLRVVAPATRSGLQLLQGEQVILRQSQLEGHADLPRFLRQSHSSVAPVGLPARTRAIRGDWSVMVTHDHQPWTELALWSVPLAFALLLGMTYRHEQRYARRLADRSQELESLSAELIRANRSKSEFLANVSHELRTPLNAIVGFTDLLREGVYGPLSTRQLVPLERIDVSAGHLRQLVDQVLDLAKMASGRMELQPEPISLRPFVFDVATEIESLVNEAGLALSLAVPSTLPRVRTDPMILRQILLNLLGNAVKFTPSGGISVRARLVSPAPDGAAGGNGDQGGAGRGRSPGPPSPAGHWVALQVVDTGIGIDASYHARIFDEFEQVNAGARGDSMERGTGLGLALARRMARLLGGDVTVESNPGEGSIFTVWLPVRRSDLNTPVRMRKEESVVA